MTCEDRLTSEDYGESFSCKQIHDYTSYFQSAVRTFWGKMRPEILHLKKAPTLIVYKGWIENEIFYFLDIAIEGYMHKN